MPKATDNVMSGQGCIEATKFKILFLIREKALNVFLFASLAILTGTLEFFVRRNYNSRSTNKHKIPTSYGREKAC